MKTLTKPILLFSTLLIFPSSASDTPVKWEYMVETMETAQRIFNQAEKSVSYSSNMHLSSKLEKLGLKRWELISVVPIDGAKNKAVYYFKRPIIPRVLKVREDDDRAPALQREESRITPSKQS